MFSLYSAMICLYFFAPVQCAIWLLYVPIIMHIEIYAIFFWFSFQSFDYVVLTDRCRPNITVLVDWA